MSKQFLKPVEITIMTRSKLFFLKGVGLSQVELVGLVELGWLGWVGWVGLVELSWLGRLS